MAYDREQMRVYQRERRARLREGTWVSGPSPTSEDDWSPTGKPDRAQRIEHGDPPEHPSERLATTVEARRPFDKGSGALTIRAPSTNHSRFASIDGNGPPSRSTGTGSQQTPTQTAAHPAGD